MAANAAAGTMDPDRIVVRPKLHGAQRPPSSEHCRSSGSSRLVLHDRHEQDAACYTKPWTCGFYLYALKGAPASVEMVAQSQHLQCGLSASDLAVLRDLVGLIALDDALRPKAPIVPQRLRPVHLGIEREFLVPRARIEVAKVLVLHLVHLAENFDAHEVGVAVVGRDVVADNVAAGTPDKMHVVVREGVDRLVNLRPVDHLEGDVMKLRLLVDDEVERMVVGVAAQEHEKVAAPVRHPEAEDLAVELHDLLHVEHAIGNVAKLEDVEDRWNAIELGKLVRGEEIKRRTLRVLEGDGLRNAGRYSRAAL